MRYNYEEIYYRCKRVKQRNFWYLDDERKLLSYPFGSVNSIEGIAKSRNTYNHKNLWNDLKPNNKVSYNYYPRGRVDFNSQGKPTIYLNRNIPEDIIIQIKLDFGIRPSDNCRLKYDFSEHYKCHLDEGWREN